MTTINILGQDYNFKICKTEEDTELKNNPNLLGECRYFPKEIVVDDCISDIPERLKNIIRHEIIHAFLYESGKSEAIYNDEELVCWIALQFPKMLEIFKQVDAL